MASNDITKRREKLADGISAMGLNVNSEAQQRLLDYLALLEKWNRAYNLTAVRDGDEMVTRHLLDSLSIDPHLQGQRFLDVGTGAGLPGMVLALIHPERHYTLLDSNGKKTRFLQEVQRALAVGNVDIHQQRVEQFSASPGYDGILSRAFATLADMVFGSGHLLAAGGHFYAMKGQYPSDELAQLPAGVALEMAQRLQVPGETGERHLLVLSPRPLASAGTH